MRSIQINWIDPGIARITVLLDPFLRPPRTGIVGDKGLWVPVSQQNTGKANDSATDRSHVAAGSRGGRACASALWQGDRERSYFGGRFAIWIRVSRTS